MPAIGTMRTDTFDDRMMVEAEGSEQRGSTQRDATLGRRQAVKHRRRDYNATVECTRNGGILV